MKLLADEGVDKPIVDCLRGVGHEVYYVPELQSGMPDDQVLNLARQKHALLITMDTDFGELVFRLKEASNGVLLLRIHGLSMIEKISIVTSVFKQHHDEIENNFTVVTKEAIRIRKLPT